MGIDLCPERLPVSQCGASAHHGARVKLPPPCASPEPRAVAAKHRRVRERLRIE